MLFTRINRYAVSIAMVILGLSGCDSPLESAEVSSPPKIDAIFSSKKKPKRTSLRRKPTMASSI